MSCYWLIARDQGATWGKQNFHCWFILSIICQHYPHVYETSNVHRRRLYLHKDILLIWLLKQYDCDLKSNNDKENSLARIVNEIGYLQLSDHLSLSSGWYNSNKSKFKSQDLNGLFFCKQSSSSHGIIFSVLIMQSGHNQRIAPWKHCGCSSCSTTTRGSDLWTTLGRSREQGGAGSSKILSHCIRDKGKDLIILLFLFSLYFWINALFDICMKSHFRQ